MLLSSCWWLDAHFHLHETGGPSNRDYKSFNFKYLSLCVCMGVSLFTWSFFLLIGTAIILVSTLRQIIFYILLIKKKIREEQVPHILEAHRITLNFTDISICKLWFHWDTSAFLLKPWGCCRDTKGSVSMAGSDLAPALPLCTCLSLKIGRGTCWKQQARNTAQTALLDWGQGPECVKMEPKLAAAHCCESCLKQGNTLPWEILLFDFFWLRIMQMCECGL